MIERLLAGLVTEAALHVFFSFPENFWHSLTFVVGHLWSRRKSVVDTSVIITDRLKSRMKIIFFNAKRLYIE